MTNKPTTYDTAFYIEKCRYHLNRTLLVHELGHQALAGHGAEGLLPRHEPLMSSDAASDPEKRRRKLSAIIDEAHLLLLKANFELLLSVVAQIRWTALLERRMGGNNTDTLNSAALAILAKQSVSAADLFNTEVRDLVDQLLPDHGLSGLARALKGVDIDLEKLSKATASGKGAEAEQAMRRSHYPMAQIRVCFAVRHLVEHSRGRADKRFIDQVGKFGWKASSWGRDKTPVPSLGSKVLVDRNDVTTTGAAMLVVLKAMEWAL